jgi:hypothetical protein
MARGRDIKPGFFDNEELASVSRDHRLLFIALWTMADREGRLEDRPQRIKVHSFPYDADITPERISQMLDDLARAPGCPIVRYEVDGVRCICVANFKKHQHIHPNEKASELPAPIAGCAGVGKLPESSGKATEPSGNYALPSEPSSLRGSVSPDPTTDLSASDPDPERARSNDSARKLTGFDLLVKFGSLRRRILDLQSPPGTERPKDTNGKAATFAEQLTPDEAADVEATMRLAFEHIRAGSVGWTDSRIADAEFAFGTWKSKFGSLREELHGCAPKLKQPQQQRQGRTGYAPSIAEAMAEEETR